MLHLRGCHPGRIQQALRELPETLDETYERTLREINKANWNLAHRLFQCVAVASRPLLVKELAEFLAFDFNASPTPRFIEGWRPEDPINAVLSTCRSFLIVIDIGNSQDIQFLIILSTILDIYPPYRSKSGNLPLSCIYDPCSHPCRKSLPRNHTSLK